jgi:hypothetical protein
MAGIGHESEAAPAADEEPLELTDAFESELVEEIAEPEEAEAAFEGQTHVPSELEPEAEEEFETEPEAEEAAVEVAPQDEFVAEPAWEAEPAFEAEPDFEVRPEPEAAPEAIAQEVTHFAWEDGPLHDDEDGVALSGVDLDENAALADRLWAARETAESVKAGEGRTRSALYKALSLAYDFAVAANENPDEYAELLEESGVKAQARAPMTPIVKLVFGIDYDKARLTEFAAALSYAQRQEIVLGRFQDFIEKQAGGLKALVAAERQARRPEAQADTKGEVARARLRSAPSISLQGLHEEFALVLTRRGADGTHEPVAVVDDEALVERAIRRSA